MERKQLKEYFTKKLYKMPLTSENFVNAIIDISLELNQVKSDNYVFCKGCGALKYTNTKCIYCG